jgi:hypothetical protein
MLADDVRSFYVKPEDKQNIAILQKARPGVSLSYLVRELLAREVARLEHTNALTA